MGQVTRPQGRFYALIQLGVVFMIRLFAFCLTVVLVSFVLVDVCGVRPSDITASGLAMQIRSLVRH